MADELEGGIPLPPIKRKNQPTTDNGIPLPPPKKKSTGVNPSSVSPSTSPSTTPNDPLENLRSLGTEEPAIEPVQPASGLPSQINQISPSDATYNAPIKQLTTTGEAVDTPKQQTVSDEEFKMIDEGKLKIAKENQILSDPLLSYERYSDRIKQRYLDKGIFKTQQDYYNHFRNEMIDSPIIGIKDEGLKQEFQFLDQIDALKKTVEMRKQSYEDLKKQGASIDEGYFQKTISDAEKELKSQSDAYQGFLNKKYQDIDNQIAYLNRQKVNYSDAEDLNKIDDQITKLQNEKLHFYDSGPKKDQATYDVVEPAIQRAGIKGANTREKLENYTAALFEEYKDLNKIIYGGEGLQGALDATGFNVLGIGSNISPKVRDRYTRIVNELQFLVPALASNRNPLASNETSTAQTFGKAFSKINYPGLASNMQNSSSEIANNIVNTFNAIGVGDEIDQESFNVPSVEKKENKDGIYYAEPSTGKKVADMLGTTTGIVADFVAASPVPGGNALASALKVERGLQYLGTLAKNSEKYGKFLYYGLSGVKNVAQFTANAAKSGVDYAKVGALFPNADDEANFGSGAAGYAGEALIKAVGGKVGLANLMTGIFGSKATEAAGKIFGRGAGELGEETAQTLYDIYKTTDGGKDFMAAVKKQFPETEDKVFFALSTFLMGAAMGGASPAGPQLLAKSSEIAKTLPEDQKKIYDNVITETTEDVQKAVEKGQEEGDIAKPESQITPENQQKVEESAATIQNPDATAQEKFDSAKEIRNTIEAPAETTTEPETKTEETSTEPITNTENEIDQKGRQDNQEGLLTQEEDAGAVEAAPVVEPVQSVEDGVTEKTTAEQLPIDTNIEQPVAQDANVPQQDFEVIEDNDGSKTYVFDTKDVEIDESPNGTATVIENTLSDKPKTQEFETVKDAMDYAKTVPETKSPTVEIPYQKEALRMSRPEFVAKMTKGIGNKEAAGKAYDDARDAVFNPQIDKAKQDLDSAIRESRNNLSSNPIGSFKAYSAMTKLMGLYIKKGVTKFADFVKVSGIKSSEKLKQLWNKVSKRPELPKSVSGAKLKTLNSRLLYKEALSRIPKDTKDAQAKIDELQDLIHTLDVMKIHSLPEQQSDVQDARDALANLYVELSADIEKVNERLANEAEIGEQMFDLKESLNIVEKAQLAIEDDFIWQKTAQKQIEDVKGVLPDNMNSYLQRDISVGKIKAKVDKVYQEIFGKSYGDLTTNKKGSTGLLAEMAKDGVTQQELDLFMYAQHAKERNARVKALHELDENVDPAEIPQAGSGMTDEQADKFLEEFKQGGKIEKLQHYAQKFRDIVIKPAINNLEAAGVITDEEAETLRTGESSTGIKFEHYVPLKVNGDMIQDAKGSASFNGSVLKRISGTDKYDYIKRNSPFAQALQDFKASVKVAEDNKVKQSLYKLAEANPNPQVWKIVPAQFVEGHEITKEDVRNNGVPVKVDGKKKYIYLKHEGLREAWLRTKSDPGRFVRMVANMFRTFNNFKRLILTQLNPVFGVKNLERDIQDAVFNASSLNIPGAGRKIVKSLPKIQGALLKATLGNLDPESKYGKLLDEYLANGGRVSWIDAASFDTEQKNIKQLVNNFNNPSVISKIIKNPYKYTVATLGAVNEAIEVGTRLAVYKTAREAGYSPEKAAGISKNLSINFNKKGQATPLINTLYLFSNAGIQANITGLRNVLTSKKTRRYAFQAAALGLGYKFLQSYLSDIMSKDDEEKEYYNKLITEGEREGVVYLPIGDKKVLTIPKSYGILRTFFNLGEQTASIIEGKDPLDATADWLGTAGALIDPIGGGTPNKLSAYTPTLFRGFVEVQNNKKWNDSPIMPDQSPFGLKVPDSQRYFRSTPDMFKDAAKFMYDNTGHAIDVSPETLEYIAEDFTGGIIKELKNTGGIVEDIYKEKPVDKNKIPFYSTFVKDLSKEDWRYSKAYYEILDKATSKILSEAEQEELKRYGRLMGKPVKTLKRELSQVRRAQKKLKEELETD